MEIRLFAGVEAKVVKTIPLSLAEQKVWRIRQSSLVLTGFQWTRTGEFLVISRLECTLKTFLLSRTRRDGPGQVKTSVSSSFSYCVGEKKNPV